MSVLCEKHGLYLQEIKECPYCREFTTEIESLRRALAEKERGLKELKEKFLLTYCAYCGEKFPADKPDKTDDISAHIRTCEKHPRRELESALARARVALTKIADATKGCKSGGYKHLHWIAAEALSPGKDSGGAG